MATISVGGQVDRSYAIYWYPTETQSRDSLLLISCRCDKCRYYGRIMNWEEAVVVYFLCKNKPVPVSQSHDIKAYGRSGRQAPCILNLDN
jgi:hypothetical protein